MKLYWATTLNNFENWFVVAKSKIIAQRFHEDSEGFNKGSAKAQFICQIDEEVCRKDNTLSEPAFWPSLDLLKKIKAKIITDKSPRIINLNGKVYIVGGSVESILIDETSKEPGLYVIKIQGTSRYKIGITINIKKRLKDFTTGNPYNLKLVYFVATSHYKSSEKFLHYEYKKKCVRGEWFSFTPKILKKLELELQFICSQNNEFRFFDVKKAQIFYSIF